MRILDMELVRMAKKRRMIWILFAATVLLVIAGAAIYLFLINGNRSPEGEDVKLVYYQRTGGNCVE
jgi:flagellar basal body-associated protein FliL